MKYLKRLLNLIPIWNNTKKAEKVEEPSWIKRLEEDGILRNELTSLGWAIWFFNEDGANKGYVTEVQLRQLADIVEARNKPFWDEYDEYMRKAEEDGDLPEEVEFPGEFKVLQEVGRPKDNLD